MKGYDVMLEKYVRCLSVDHRYKHVDNDASYLTIKEGKKLYIYFQWSDSIRDWVNNFRFLARPIRPYKDMNKGGWFCHGGFLDVWKSIEPLIADEIRDVEIEEIEIVGYSHGAAIAQLCYEYVKYHRQDVTVTGVGFGSPRVVWGFISKEAKKRFKGFIVVRNCRDIVTKVPPVLFGFRHISKVVKIGSHSEGSFDDHRPELYIESLEEEILLDRIKNVANRPCAKCNKRIGDTWHIREGKYLCSLCTAEYDEYIREFYSNL